MTDAGIAARWQFAFTIMFHYLFPILTMGLGVLIAVLKTLHLRTGKGECTERRPVLGAHLRHHVRDGRRHRHPDGVPVRHELGPFLAIRRAVVGQTLFMEGRVRVLRRISFLGVFLLRREARSPASTGSRPSRSRRGRALGLLHRRHQRLDAASGRLRVVDERVELTSLWALLIESLYVRWQYPHVIIGIDGHGSMVVAGVGAYYLLARKHEAIGRVFVRVGVIAGCSFALIVAVPDRRVSR